MADAAALTSTAGEERLLRDSYPSSRRWSMYARVATFEGGDTQKIREMTGSAETRPAPPEGMKRVLMLSDDAGARRLFIAFFDSREALDAAEARFESMG